MKPAQQDARLRPARGRAVAGLRPDGPRFRPLPDKQAGHFDFGQKAPQQPLSDDEAEAWAELAAPCCYTARTDTIRLGLHRDGAGRLHVRGCDQGTGSAISLDAARGAAERG